MGKSTFLVVIGLLLISAVKAQSTVTVKGKITDSAGAPLAGARIDLFSIKDAPSTYNAVTGSNGSFELVKVNADTFRVLINMSGYPPVTKTWIISDSSADMGTILISKTEPARADSNTAVAATAKPDTARPDSTTANRSKTTDSSVAANRTTTDSGFHFRGVAG